MKTSKAMTVVPKSLFLISTLVFSSCALFHNSSPTLVDELIITPDKEGHKEFIRGIQGAKRSVWMKMYHLTDPEVVRALITAHQNQIDVKVILDNVSTEIPKFQRVYNELKSAGIGVLPSSTCFSIMHEKSMIIDSKLGFITSLNMTRPFDVTRDYGVITDDQEILKEMNDVFKADWENAKTSSCKTPPLTNKFLVWSPVNAEQRLVDLIRSSHSSVFINVENLGNKKIEEALIEASARGVTTKVIVPQCDKNKNPLYNYPLINRLRMGGVEVKVMPHPESREHPYMHAKMILIDEAIAYVGSTNFSNNSLLRARECGIIFNDEKPVEKILTEFKKDWFVSIPPTPIKEEFCPAKDF